MFLIDELMSVKDLPINGEIVTSVIYNFMKDVGYGIYNEERYPINIHMSIRKSCFSVVGYIENKNRIIYMKLLDKLYIVCLDYTEEIISILNRDIDNHVLDVPYNMMHGYATFGSLLPRPTKSARK